MRLNPCAAASLWLGLSLASPALAQHGASDERVSLPEGPGSLEGIGDNALINANMGSMQYAVPIEVPAGFPAVTPNLALAYDSSGPAGVMGIGWDLSVPFVERMTNWSLPEYTLDDDFLAGGQLVHVGDGVYRNRFEKGFSRHTWHDRGDGTQGYWTTELPDGTVQYFGADAAGNLVDSARVAGRAGATFRYHLVEQVDRFGHAMRFEYATYDGLPHLDRITYIFTGADGGPGASLRFEYEDRPDVLTDARSGATERRTQRLAAVNVFSKQVRIWRYMVEYEDARLSNGLSRVQRIHRVGLDETPHPVAFDFEYSKTLANDNCDADCDQPYLVDMGSIGVNLAAGDATLADMNGDGLPDIIDTSREGAHRIFINRYQARDSHAFDAPVDSATGNRAGHQLSSPYVQTLDANGDGRVDLLNVRTGEVLFNLGDGDWSPAEALGDTGNLPDFGDDFPGGDEQPTHIRFFDYDNDRRIDVLRSTAFETTIYANRGAAGFEVVEADAIQAGFEGGLELADMNGDGLQDAVFLRPGSLSYRANLGFGRWSAWYDIEDLPFNAAEQQFVELQDINGDSLDDLVIVLGDELRFALNRAGTHFDRPRGIDAVGGQALPIRADGTTVLFADMNGSGSDDVVWISAQGDVTYLELFPVRPNLLTRLTNGLGLVTEVTYTTMVEELAAAAEPWAYTLPFSMIMAKSIDTFDSINAVHRRQEYRYADAFYDGEEKAYRGFARVTTTTPGDESQESGVEEITFDVGAEDRYRNGLELARASYAVVDDALEPLRSQTFTYDDCPVADVPDETDWPIRHVCRTARETVEQERAPAADWVRMREEFAYDGDGNLTLRSNFGIVDVGGAGCGACDRPAGEFGAPCGATCDGDEMHVVTDFTRSSTRWLLGLPVEVASSAVLDDPAAQVTRYRYDGAAFEGLPAGQATDGLVSRVQDAVDAGQWIDTQRNAHDAHGNLVESLDPRADRGSAALRTHREYDDEHLLLTRIMMDFGDYQLATENRYDPIWGVIEWTSGPRAWRDGEALTPARPHRFTYDALSQIESRANPGDPADRPTIEFEPQFGAPVSRMVTRMRTARGAAEPDVTTVLCRDGFGHDIAQLTEAAPGVIEVGTFSRLNRRGKEVTQWRGHIRDDDSCLLDPPDTIAQRVRYDALGRSIGFLRDDAALYGTPTRTRIEHAPRARHQYTAFDLEPDHAHFDTPSTERFDGLGRRTHMTYRLTADGAPITYTYTYDVRGAVIRVTDPAGHARRFERDRLGRLIATQSPDQGRFTRTLDAVGNPVRIEDAEGRVEEIRYDLLSRPTERWDPADPDGTRVEFLYDLPEHCPDGACPQAAYQLVGLRFPTPNGRGARWITHDDRGRQTRIRTVLDGYTLDERFEYDNLGRLIAITQPDGTVERRTLDGVGRVIDIDGIARIAWARSALLARLELANGLTTTFTHDALDQPAGLELSGPDGTLLDLRYVIGRDGNLMAIDDLSVPADQPGRSMRLTFDALDRLATAHLDAGRADFEEVLTYGYDAALNLVDKTSSRGAASASHVGALRYEGDQPHAVTSAGARTYAHDLTGLTIDHAGDEYTWDHRRRLTRVEREGQPIARYWYAEQRLITQLQDVHRVDVSPTFVIEDGIALSHTMLGLTRLATRETDVLAPRVLGDLAPLIDDLPVGDDRFDTGDAVVAARAAAGDIALPENVHHADLRSMLRGSVRSRLLGGAPRITYAHHDASRQLVLSTDADGAIVERFAVDPHGMPRGGVAARGFEGRQTDGETGLLTMGDRAFDPWLGRWVAPDPTVSFGTSDLESRSPVQAHVPYAFVLDNPVRFTDPSGRAGEVAAQLDAVSAIGGLRLGNFARGPLDTFDLVEFAFNTNFDDLALAMNNVMDRIAAVERQLPDLQDQATLTRALANSSPPNSAEAARNEASARAAEAELATAQELVDDFRNVKRTLYANIRVARYARTGVEGNAKRPAVAVAVTRMRDGDFDPPPAQQAAAAPNQANAANAAQQQQQRQQRQQRQRRQRRGFKIRLPKFLRR